MFNDWLPKYKKHSTITYPKRVNLYTMKYFFICFILLMSCKKSNENRTCWDCEVTRMDGTKYNDRTCSDDGTVPHYTDNLGNDLNSFCTKR